MNNSETNFEDVLKGESKIEIVDKLENLRNQLNSNTLKGRINKKDILKSIDEIIDSMPVEMRTARWIVREQESFINQAKIESKALLDDAKAESEKLIANSYVIQEAVIEANAIIKQAEVEMQTYRTNIEDTIDQRIDDIQNKIDKLSKALAKAFTDYIQRQNFVITEMQAPVLAPPPVGGKGMAVLTKSGKNTIGDPLAQANWPASEVKAVRIDTTELR